MSVSDTSRHPLPEPSHSNEVESRLTKLEIRSEAHHQKLTLHEKAILGIASSLYVMAQDQFPRIAAVIRGLLIP